MGIRSILLALSLTSLVACGVGAAGDPCAQDDECEADLECSIEDGEEEGTCAEPAEE